VTNQALRLKFTTPWSDAIIGLERIHKRRQRRAERLARGYPNAINKARMYEAALAEPGASYRTVARRFQVTREEVCQYMAVLNRLPTEIVAMIECESDAARLRLLSLRRLLRIARMSTDLAKREAFSLAVAAFA
jgi:hypothetical protein